MCGIYGTTLRYSPDIVSHKLELMKFRGPDHIGIKAINTPDGEVLTFGHVRLSIIDLDARSNQPFEYNEHIIIVFNGEIYNYRELKKQYLSDVKFRTESDTEVICALYERYGFTSVCWLNGMFAFVIYDRRQNIMVGARDRLGKKPFYYWYSEKGFEFASQPKVIQHGNDFQVDTLARQLYLLHGYIPDPYCIYSGVRKLRAGEWFTYKIEEGKLDIKTYWNIFTNSCQFETPKTYDEAKDTIKELLFDAVRLRLNANVPVGMFLSGGIDSSLVCSIVSKINKDICAYTIGFDNAKYDESSYATDVAQSLDIPIKVSICHGTEQQHIFDDYINYFDEPFSDPSMIPSSLVAQKAREDVTVVLGGDGGDELFFGYKKYEYIEPRLKQYKKPYWMRKLASPYFYWKGGQREMLFSTQKNYADVFRSEGIFCYSFDGAETFNRIELARHIPDRELMLDERGILAYSDFDIKFFLNAMNQKVDRASMRSSLELRSPLMDYRLAEYTRLLPYNYLYTPKLQLKSLLKDILYDMVPRTLLDRPKKGFSPPTEDWFNSELRNKYASCVTKQKVKELLPELNVKKIEKLHEDFIKGEKVDARIFWTLYTYINWHNKYLQK
mgnify:CR=1 FL=1